MRVRQFLVAATTAVVFGAGVAIAAHVGQVDPATVPTGFLATHSAIADVPVSALARAVKPGGTDMFVQHVRLGGGVSTAWHTHPGPALVSVVRGALSYEAAQANRCVQTTYGEGQGFVDRGFGHVHRATAGPVGVDFYVVYLLPPGSENHVVSAEPPAECSS